MPKAAPQSESLAQLALPARQVRKAQSGQRGHKAAPKMGWLAQLALPARQVRKAQSGQRAPKAPRVW